MALPSLWRTDSQYLPGCSFRTMRTLAALPRSSSHARTAPGSAGPCDVSTGVAGTLGGHDVGGGASDLEVVSIYLPASGEVGQAIKLVIGGPANLTAHLTTVSQPGVPSVEQPSTSRPRRGVKVAG